MVRCFYGVPGWRSPEVLEMFRERNRLGRIELDEVYASTSAGAQRKLRLFK